MQGTEHDIVFVLALGCAIALHCIALHCIVAFEDTVQGWVQRSPIVRSRPFVAGL